MGMMTKHPQEAVTPPPAPAAAATPPAPHPAQPTAKPKQPPMPEEFGGPSGPEPTRYGDWERKGRVSDF